MEIMPIIFPKTDCKSVKTENLKNLFKLSTFSVENLYHT